MTSADLNFIHLAKILTSNGSAKFAETATRARVKPKPSWNRNHHSLFVIHYPTIITTSFSVANCSAVSTASYCTPHCCPAPGTRTASGLRYDSWMTRDSRHEVWDANCACAPPVRPALLVSQSGNSERQAERAATFRCASTHAQYHWPKDIIQIKVK